MLICHCKDIEPLMECINTDSTMNGGHLHIKMSLHVFLISQMFFVCTENVILTLPEQVRHIWEEDQSGELWLPPQFVCQGVLPDNIKLHDNLRVKKRIMPMFANTSMNYSLFVRMLLPPLRGGLFLTTVTRTIWSLRYDQLSPQWLRRPYSGQH